MKEDMLVKARYKDAPEDEWFDVLLTEDQKMFDKKTGLEITRTDLQFKLMMAPTKSSIWRRNGKSIVGKNYAKPFMTRLFILQNRPGLIITSIKTIK
jgi:hypothetical protein